MSVTLITNYTVSTPNTVTTITFSNIPQTYVDLIIIPSFNNDGYSIRFNNDNSSSYGNRAMVNFDAFPIRGYTNLSNYTDKVGTIVAGSLSGFTAAGYVYIANYTSSTVNKTALAQFSIDQNTTSDYYYENILLANNWNNTSAITTITINPDGGSYLTAGSNVQLYGIRNS